MITKVIAVTGASRGIGATIALELARRGFTVACLTRKGQGPEVAVPADLAARCVNVCCDVTDERSVKQALAGIVAKAGSIHGLVNNAGIHLDGPSDKLTLDVYNQVMSTNATAVFTACREVYPHLVEAGGGIIVNIGSFFDKIGVKRNVAYCASKAGVAHLTRALAVAWAPSISVNSVAPGVIPFGEENEPRVQTLIGKSPAKRPGTGQEIAEGVIHFLTASTFTTGQVLAVDGGLNLL